MADKTTGKVPRIRFKAYTEPWADEKIGDVIAERRRPIVLEDDQRYELITVKRRNEGVVYFERIEGTPLPMFKVKIKAANLLRDFLIRGVPPLTDAESDVQGYADNGSCR